MRAHVSRLAVCFALGAVVGTLLDGIHAYGDVLSYAEPAFGRWAAFVPLEFGLLGLAAGILTPFLERLATPSEPEPGPRWTRARGAAELALFAILYALTAITPSEAAPLLAVGLGTLAVARLVFERVPGDLLYVALATVLGPAGEIAISAAGAFDYSHPDVAGIPIWLPALWANGGFLIRRVVQPIVCAPAAPSPSGQQLRPARGTGVGRS